jgi:threonine/homoserine/homoserine lactone efflux protein
VVKLAGAAYLIYLGVSTLFSLRNKLAVEVMAAGIPLPYRKIFLQAVLVNALNPKVALFFMAFLPQFVSPGTASPAISFIFLGCLFNCNGTLVNIIFATCSAKIAGRFKRYKASGRLLKSGVGGLFIWLGVRLAFTTQR